MKRVAVLALSATLLAACDGVVGAKLTYDDTEAVKVTEIVLTGGAADVTVTTDAVTDGTRIRRIVRGGSEPGPSYTLDGTRLTLGTECQGDCQVSYEIAAPPGVNVRGELAYGDVSLTGIGTVDVRLTAGDIHVDDAGGPVTLKSGVGDLTVTGAPSATLTATTGDLHVRDIAGAVDARTTTGDIDVEMTTAASVTAVSTTGDVEAIVPGGSYRIRTDTESGDVDVAGRVTNDAKAVNVLDLRTSTGDLSVTGAP
ncbi:DUF4097 family beta strand repeat-containing protein [Actinoplanes sp. NPDC051851]|uniref:DUF4097 family beta strand repeat-containing protein n=1 Tax=Actinoplanes sp. NPDC051851 TaxID=3154753 RepID=UPI00344A957E